MSSAEPVAVEVAQPDAPVAAAGAGENRAVQFEPHQSLRIRRPALAVEVPHAREVLVSDQGAGHAVGPKDAESHAGFTPVALGVNAHQRNGEVGDGPRR